ncbi:MULTISPECIES: hypothetical protein [Vibrio]|uniref:Uncharacterized protein n=1 Tax=Vibrio splendidus TaxID=29497 RepID=A0A2N7JXD5_VIBSP|nr:hypothetical protein [Vibrio splendidus]PMM64856.1 hypothetical protein BCT54_17330 [Vibrio splendidus]
MNFFTLAHHGRPYFSKLSLRAASKGKPYHLFVTGKTHLSLYAQDQAGVAWGEVYRQALSGRGVALTDAAIIAHHPDETESAQWQVAIINDGEVVNYWAQGSAEVSGRAEVQAASVQYWIGGDEAPVLPSFQSKANIERLAPLSQEEHALIAHYTLKRSQIKPMLFGVGGVGVLLWAGLTFWATPTPKPIVVPVKEAVDVEIIAKSVTPVLKADPFDGYRHWVQSRPIGYALMEEIGMAMIISDDIPVGWSVSGIQSKDGNVQIQIEKEEGGEIGMMLGFTEYFSGIKPYTTLWSDRAEIAWENDNRSEYWLTHGLTHAHTKVALQDLMVGFSLSTKVMQEQVSSGYIVTRIDVKGQLEPGHMNTLSKALKALPVMLSGATLSPTNTPLWDVTLSLSLFTMRGTPQ